MDNSPQHSIRHRIIRSAWTAIASTAMIGGSLMIAVGPASANPPASPNQYSLNQCANGGKGTLAQCSGSNYQSGDLNSNDSHWAEGDFVPFQLQLTDVTHGNHFVTIQYEVVGSGIHAYDYLGSYDATETTGGITAAHANGNDPCTGVLSVSACSTTPLTAPIPSPDLAGANSLCGSAGNVPATPAVGYFTLWGASAIGTVQYVSQNQPQGGSNCNTTIEVNFTSPADGSNLVLAWGGHIASALDWGHGNGAGSISGAPFHMWMAGLDGSGGAQQRSIQVSSLQPTISTVIEDAAGTPVTSVPVGTPVHDTAILSGASSTAGGTVTYELFDTGNCTASENPNFPTSSVVTVNNGIVPNSTDFTTAAPGEYSYLVTYSGDPGNEGAVATCEGPLGVTEAAAPIVNVLKSEPTPGDGTTVAPGQATPITYKLAVTNSGTAAATDVVVTDTIPTGTTYVTDSAQPVAEVSFPSAGTIQWTIPTLAAITGTTPTEVDLTFQVMVKSSDADGSTITNQASYTGANIPCGATDPCLTKTVTNKVAVQQTGSNPQSPPTTVVQGPRDTVVSTTTTTLKPALAFTGAHTGLLSLLGAGLIGTGGAVLALSRRRRRRPSGR